MCSTTINQKDYLKKYLSGDKKKKSKKKKRTELQRKGIKVIDDCNDLSGIPFGFEEEDEAPTIAEITYENEKLKEIEQFTANNKWKNLESKKFTTEVSFRERLKEKANLSSSLRKPYELQEDRPNNKIDKEHDKKLGIRKVKKDSFSFQDSSQNYIAQSKNKKYSSMHLPSQIKQISDDSLTDRKQINSVSKKNQQDPNSSSRSNLKASSLSKTHVTSNSCSKNQLDSDTFPSKRRDPNLGGSASRRKGNCLDTSSHDRKNDNSEASPPRRKRHDSDVLSSINIRHNQNSSPQRRKRHDSDISSTKVRQDSDDSPPRKRRYDSDASPPRKMRHDSDASPTRKMRHDSDDSAPRKMRHDSDVSPPRKLKYNTNTSPSRRKRHDSDASPPRRARHDSDASPPRRARHDSDALPPRRTRHDSDSSTRRKRHDSDASPPRRTRHDSDASPPRRTRHDSDASPPRRTRHDSDASPPRRTRHDSDASPPRRTRHDSDSSTRRKRHDSDASPPRRKNSFNASSPHSRRHGSDASPPRKSLSKEGSKMHVLSQRPEKNMTAADYLKARKFGKLKKDTPEDIMRREREAELQKQTNEMHKKWNKGMLQGQKYEQKVAEFVHEAGKSFARQADDIDMNDQLKNKMREEDPMFEYIMKKKTKEDTSQKFPIYQGSFPPNRFNIRPGYRWDGVDRSTGYEKEWFSRQNSKKATEEESYKWSIEDM